MSLNAQKISALEQNLTAEQGEKATLAKEKNQIESQLRAEQQRSEILRSNKESLQQSVDAIQFRYDSMEKTYTKERVALAKEKDDQARKLTETESRLEEEKGLVLALREQINSMQEIQQQEKGKNAVQDIALKEEVKELRAGRDRLKEMNEQLRANKAQKPAESSQAVANTADDDLLTEMIQMAVDKKVPGVEKLKSEITRVEQRS